MDDEYIEFDEYETVPDGVACGLVLDIVSITKAIAMLPTSAQHKTHHAELLKALKASVKIYTELAKDTDDRLPKLSLVRFKDDKGTK